MMKIICSKKSFIYCNFPKVEKCADKNLPEKGKKPPVGDRAPRTLLARARNSSSPGAAAVVERAECPSAYAFTLLNQAYY